MTTRQIDGARKLIGLHAYERDHGPSARPFDFANYAIRPDTPIGFVVGVQTQLDVGTEHRTPLSIFRQTVQASERIGRNCRADPLDRITVVIIV